MQNETLSPFPKSDAELLMDFLVPHIQFVVGQRVAWEVIYEWYCDAWADGPEAVKALSVREFGAALADVCERTPIRVQKLHGRVFCLDVRLIDPGVKALPAPAQAASPQT